MTSSTPSVGGIHSYYDNIVTYNVQLYNVQLSNGMSLWDIPLPTMRVYHSVIRHLLCIVRTSTEHEDIFVNSLHLDIQMLL